MLKHKQVKAQKWISYRELPPRSNKSTFKMSHIDLKQVHFQNCGTTTHQKFQTNLYSPLIQNGYKTANKLLYVSFNISSHTHTP
jgi:hypothetical protein